MEFEDAKQALVDPELRSFIFNRVSSLGGSSAAEDGQYVLGDDLLPSLKDIRDWLRHFNDQLNRLDVARLLAEANIVQGDLLEILAGWQDVAAEDSYRSKVALRCVDLLMQLTWPVDRDENNTTQNLLFHKPFVQAAQASYKQSILQHHTKILRKAARAGLPAIAQPQRERSAVDESIINVVLYFFRNVAMIQKPDQVDAEEDDTEISRSTTIEAFHVQDTFDLLLAIGSGIADDFQHHDLELLDVLFHLLKGVDVDRLFMERSELISSNTRELRGLIGKERNMHLGYARHAPSRHNRFGTMVWMKRNDGKMSTLVGQTATTDDQSTLGEMDRAKKWKKPRRPFKGQLKDHLNEFDGTVPLTDAARKHLRHFVEQFLDSSFNPLFIAVRRSIEREVSRLQEYHKRQYFFLVSWFLQAESARRRKQSQPSNSNSNGVQDHGSESFGLVAGVLTQETFVLLSRKMQDAQDHRKWQDLTACMKCFTQILLTVQEMVDSKHEDDQEVAENMLSRIFYEQSTHDQVSALLKTFKEQGFPYLDALTDFSHVFIRTLEQYSKQNVDMQVRTMRRSRKKKAASDPIQGTSNNEDQQLEPTDRQEAQRVSTDRKFDFMTFSAKMINQSSIETFLSFLKYYKELGTEQLKRAHRFLHRAAFKMELCVYLFRVDILLLLQRVVKGPDGMDQEDPIFKEWEELVRQIFRCLVKKMQERTCLGVELLFSKIPSTVYYLEHGYEKEIPKVTPRAPAELEVKPGMEKEQQISVVVSALINQSKTDHLDWVKRVLVSAIDERKAWEEMQAAQSVNQEVPENGATTADTSMSGQQREADQTSEAGERSNDRPTGEAPAILPSPILVRPDTPQRRMAMQKDKYLRLLLTLLGFDKLDITESDIDRDGILTSWTIPPSQSSVDLQTSHDTIAKFEFAPPTYEDGKNAEDFLRRKQNPYKETTAEDSNPTSGIDSDSEGDDEILFPKGGPTARKSDHELKKTKQRQKGDREPLSDEAVEAAKAARREAEKAKAAKIKSKLMISASDDDEDDDRDRAFFEKEAKMRSHQAREVQKQSMQLRGLLNDSEDPRKSTTPIEQAGNIIRAHGLEEYQTSRKRSFDESESDADEEDDSPEGVHARPTKKVRQFRQDSDESALSSNSDDLGLLSEEDVLLPQRTKRRKGPPAAKRSTGRWSDESSESTDHCDADTLPSSHRPSSGHGNTAFNASADATKNRRESLDPDSDKENAPSRSTLPAKPGAAVRTGRRAAFIIESDSDE